MWVGQARTKDTTHRTVGAAARLIGQCVAVSIEDAEAEVRLRDGLDAPAKLGGDRNTTIRETRWQRTQETGPQSSATRSGWGDGKAMRKAPGSAVGRVGDAGRSLSQVSEERAGVLWHSIYTLGEKRERVEGKRLFRVRRGHDSIQVPGRCRHLKLWGGGAYIVARGALAPGAGESGSTRYQPGALLGGGVQSGSTGAIRVESCS